MTSLYVNGDSWSFKLKQCDNKIWPELVAQNLGFDLFNDSLGCGSNSRILDSLKNRWLLGDRPSLMIFGLTAHHRYHLPAADLGSWVIGPMVALHEHTGTNNDVIKDFFFRHCYSSLDSVYRYYRDIWSIHEHCTAKGIPYLCFQTWDTEISKLNVLDGEQSIKHYVATHLPPGYTADCYISMLKSLSVNKSQWNYHESSISDLLDDHEFDNTQHPNQIGHQKIATKVLDLLKEYNLI